METSRFPWLRSDRRSTEEPTERVPQNRSGAQPKEKVPEKRAADGGRENVVKEKELELEKTTSTRGELKEKILHWGTTKNRKDQISRGKLQENVLEKETSGEIEKVAPQHEGDTEWREKVLKEKDLKEKVLKEKDPKEKVPKEKDLKEKVLKEKDLKEKDLKEKDLKEKDPKEKVLKGKDPKEKVLKEKDPKEKVLKEKDPKEKVPKEKVSEKRTGSEPQGILPERKIIGELKDKMLHWRTAGELKEKLHDKGTCVEPKQKVPDKVLEKRTSGEPKEGTPVRKPRGPCKDKNPDQKVLKQKTADLEPHGHNPYEEPREKRSQVYREISRSFSNITLRSSLKRALRRRHTELSSTRTLAVSDGELNMAPEERGGVADPGPASSSNSSLPTVQGAGGGAVGEVASWAVSFERLLQDATGVLYFTAFLRSEVSTENILFWQACEKFRHIPANHTEKLNQEARSIYTNFLSARARYPVNVDDTVRVGEKHLSCCLPDMFTSAQLQIFKLMKFDSYRRFVRSQLFQSCMLANVEGRPLPKLSPQAQSPRAGHRRSTDSPSLSHTPRPAEQKLKEGLKVKPGRSSPAEVRGEKRGGLAKKLTRDKRQEQRGSWEAEVAAALQTDPSNTPRQPVGGAEKYCCVYLPDGTASLAPTRPGLSIRSMLIGLCEKRGLPLADVTIFLPGKTKPLSLDQDSSVLREQQVHLELRVTLTAELTWTGGTMGIVVQSSKTLQEVLSPFLQEHRLRPHDVMVTMTNSGEVLSMNTAVGSLTSKHITLDRAKDGQPSQGSRPLPPSLPPSLPGDGSPAAPPLPDPSARTRQRRPAPCQAYDMNAQYCSSVDDQRGLLRRELLTLPDFLQRPLEAPGEQVGEDTRRRRTKSEDGQMNRPVRSVAGATPTSRIASSRDAPPSQRGEEREAPPPSRSPSPDPGRETDV